MRSRRQPVRGIAAQFLLCLCLCALVCVLLSGCGGKRTLPDAGFDYRVSSDGVLLGYPIPRHGANPYLLKSGDNGCAFVYDDAADTYINLPVSFETLVCGENKTISVPSTEYRGRKIYFSACKMSAGYV